MSKKCLRCGSKAKQYVHGHTTKGNVRYKCSVCKKTYILEQKYSQEFKTTAIKMYFECHSGRAVGRVMSIGKNTIWNWLEEYCQKLEEKTENDVEIAEWDELYTYCKKKRKKPT